MKIQSGGGQETICLKDSFVVDPTQNRPTLQVQPQY